jgi:hypothetical protein
VEWEDDHQHFELLSYLAEIATTIEHLPELAVRMEDGLLQCTIEDILTAAKLAESVKEEIIITNLELEEEERKITAPHIAVCAVAAIEKEESTGPDDESFEPKVDGPRIAVTPKKEVSQFTTLEDLNESERIISFTEVVHPVGGLEAEGQPMSIHVSSRPLVNDISDKMRALANEEEEATVEGCAKLPLSDVVSLGETGRFAAPLVTTFTGPLGYGLEKSLNLLNTFILDGPLDTSISSSQTERLSLLQHPEDVIPNIRRC